MENKNINKKAQDKKISTRSLIYIKRKIRKNPNFSFSSEDINNFWETGDYIKNILNGKYKEIWSENGIECQLKNKLTNQEKQVFIKYNATADFNNWQFISTLAINGTENNFNNYIKNIGKLIEKVLWGEIDICNLMPLHYDLDSEKNAYKSKLLNNGIENSKNENIDEIFKDVRETYFDYDVIYTLGNFICFQDKKESYKLEALLTNFTSEKENCKDVYKYYTFLPIRIDYIKNKN